MQETETLEFKKSISELKNALISIVSILNKHKKGRLVFGVKPNGEIIGQTVTEKTLRDVSKSISDHIEPKIYPEVRMEKMKDKECVVVEFCGNDGPYSAYGRYYKRVADEDKQLSAKELENIIIVKNKEKLRWDTDICTKAKLSDISEIKLMEFLEKSGNHYDSVESSLKKLSLMRDSKMLNAAVILFGKNPDEFYPNARLRCAVFGTNDTSVTIDMQDFKGDIFYLIDEAEKYFMKNIHIGMRVEGLRRVDVPEINKEAFREAIINAFCHRNYWKFDSVNFAIFKDRVEVRSPGLLYGGLTIDKIKSDNVSERRNELIAKLFHDVHYVENWGRGISKILSFEPDADFKEIGSHFITVFRRKMEESSDIVEKMYSEKWSERWSERWSDTLSERQIGLLKMIIDNPKISRKELSNSIGINQSAIQKHLDTLKKKGIIKRIGPDKGGYWKIVE